MRSISVKDAVKSIKYGVVRYGTVRYGTVCTVQYSTWWSKVQYGTVRDSTVHGTVKLTVRCMVQCSTVHGTVKLTVQYICKTVL